MSKTVLVLVVLFTFLSFPRVYGENKVVVVPLGKGATGDAEVSDVRTGKTFSNSTAIGLTGTLVQNPLATGTATEADVLKKKTFSNNDNNGLTGTRPPVPVAKTGQDICYSATVGGGVVISCEGTGMDGEFKKGESISPRFTDNGDGTVTDNLTDLVWLKNFNCFGRIDWAAALTAANTMESGDCGLSDGSIAGDWRLPNRFELASLLDLKQHSPALPAGHPFTNVQWDYYWTSSYHSYFVSLNVVWGVHFSAGDIEPRSMLGLDSVPNCYVQAVRDGQ